MYSNYLNIIYLQKYYIDFKVSHVDEIIVDVFAI